VSLSPNKRFKPAVPLRFARQSGGLTYALNAKDSMEHLNEIHWHDSEIESVIEVPAKDQLIYNIQHPESWDKNIFVPRAVTFNGYHSHAIEEMPFEGNPTILAVSVVKENDGFTTIKLETNAGNRYVTAKSFNIGVQSVSI
jgi:hypothetical protein